MKYLAFSVGDESEAQKEHTNKKFSARLEQERPKKLFHYLYNETLVARGFDRNLCLYVIKNSLNVKTDCN